MSTLRPTWTGHSWDKPTPSIETAERAVARHRARTRAATVRALAYSSGQPKAKERTQGAAASIAAESAVAITAEHAARLAHDAAQLALNAAVNNTSCQRDTFTATARAAAQTAQDVIESASPGLDLLTNVLADGYETRAAAALTDALHIPRRGGETAVDAEDESYDVVYVYPQDVSAYSEQTRVRQPKNGLTYRPLPFLFSEDARNASPTGALFAPGVGLHWRLAWRPLITQSPPPHATPDCSRCDP
ncbi:hypothetical protein OG285_32020 [Streptomyces sp. NBC_01471]|uniref:hypothetical protein n=1 Tax=Streptomyces sp. NBC_01471 TaxID=2903879 RepID=UPI0032469AA6